MNPGIPSTPSPVVIGATAGLSLRKAAPAEAACVRQPVCANTIHEAVDGPVSAEIVGVIDGDTILVEASPWPQQTIEVYV